MKRFIFAVMVLPALCCSAMAQDESPYLGLVVQRNTPLLAKENGFPTSSGVVVIHVINKSPAADAKLSCDDIVLRMNGRGIRDRKGFYKALERCRPGDTLTAKLYKKKFIRVRKKVTTDFIGTEIEKDELETKWEVTTMQVRLASQEFIGDKKTQLFHLPKCSRISKERTTFPCLKEAETSGFKPCRSCFPASRISGAVKPDIVEQQLGMYASMALTQKTPIYYDTAQYMRLTGVLMRIAPVTERPYSANWNVFVLDTKDVNAVAIPGGSICVNKGLLDLLETDDEIAALLAHEAAHVAHKDGVKMYYTALGVQTVASIVQAVVLYNNPKFPGWTLDTGADFLALVCHVGYGSKAEDRADDSALEYMAYAGYDPSAFVTLLEKLKRAEEEDPKMIKPLISVHRPTQERIDRTKGNIKSMPRVEPILEKEKRYGQFTAEEILSGAHIPENLPE